MAINIKRFLEGLRIFPKTSTSIDAKGELEVIDSTGKLNFHNGSSVSPVLTEAHAADITGKTLLEVDNLQLNGNTIASTDSNGNIVLDPNGNGNINLTAGGSGVVNVGSSSVNVDASGGVNITGDLDVDNININGNTIISTNTNGDITLTPNGTGLLKTDNLALATNTISSTDVNGDINLSPNGTGTVVINTDLDVDNINVNGNTISSTNSNGDITLDPNGTGLIKAESAIRIPEVSTPSTPSSGYGNIYFKSDGYLYQQDDAGAERKVGAGGGGINYISNPDSEGGIDGWTTYDDAAATPVDLTGGTFGGTFARTTTTPLRGTGSLLYTPGSIGEGVAFTITPDLADYGQVLEFGFDFDYVSATAATGDYTVWVYDVTNSTLIQPAGYQIPGATTGIYGKFKCTFQTSMTGVTYRIAIHQAASTSAAIEFDNVYCGPQLKSYGPFISDWVAWTPTGSWTANSPVYTGYKKRVGDVGYYRVRVVCGGAPTSTALTVNLPSGEVIDTSKLTTMVASRSVLVGSGNAYDSGGASYPLNVVYSSTTAVALRQISADQTYTYGADTTQIAPFTFGASDTVEFEFSVPITGWSSGMLLSSDSGDSRVVAARATGGTTSLTNAAPIVIFTSTTFDTHGKYDSGTGRYTVPVSGKYRVSAYVKGSGTALTANQDMEMYVYKNAVNASYIATVSPQASVTLALALSGSAIIDCVAGDLLDIRVYSTVTQTMSSSSNVQFERISGNQTLASSESVNARMVGTSGDSVTSGSIYAIGFDTITFDTHGIMNTANKTTTLSSASRSRAVIPISGKYLIEGTVVMESGTFTSGDYLKLSIHKNGTTYMKNTFYYIDAGSTPSISIVDILNLVAGDEISIVFSHVTGTTQYLSSTDYCTFNICRIGN